jgi:elongation factor Tu
VVQLLLVRVERGIINVGDEVEIVGIREHKKLQLLVLRCSESFLTKVKQVITLVFFFVVLKRDEVERGQCLIKPGSVKPHSKFKCEVYILTKEEGGRHTPIFKGYRPQFYFRTTDVTGAITLGEGQEMIMPGDNTSFDVELITPIAMEKGLRFAIREGGRTIGAGTVSEIVE